MLFMLGPILGTGNRVVKPNKENFALREFIF